ncbi:MAG TPA: FliH/SctL family protein [Pantanalinema sp.]
MALIKSNQLIQTGTAVVAGDQIVAGEFAPTAPAPQPEAIEHVVPAYQPEPEALEPETAEPWSEEPIAEGHETQPEEEALETAYAEAIPFEDAGDEPATPSLDLIGDFDVERDAVVQAAHEAADHAAQEAIAEIGTPDAGPAMDEAVAAIRDAFPGGPRFDSALASVAPYVEKQVEAAYAELAAHSVSDARWRELSTAEEQLAGLVDNYARRVLAEPPSELALHSLLAEREGILAEARLKAARTVQEAEVRAAQLVNEAHSQAAGVILEIETKREAMLADLRQQGYAEGYQEGRSQADEEGAKIVQDAMDSLNRMAGALREAVKQNEEKLLKLAIGIAEKVLMDEIAVRPDTVLKTLDEAISKVSDLEEVTIKVNPEDMALVTEHEETFRDRLKNVRKVEFQSSPKIQRGGVLIDTSSGSVDAQIKTQLSVIMEAFDAVRREYAEEPLDMTGG